MTLSATSRMETGKEALGSLLGITGFASYSLMAHPDSFPLRLKSIAQQYAVYRLASLKITITSYLAANDRGEFAVGFDYSSSSTTSSDYTSNSDITAIGGIRMQAGEAVRTFNVDCTKFTRRAFPYDAPHNSPPPGIANPYAYDILPGHIIIGVSGTPVNGQPVADVVAEYTFELNHPVKVQSAHAGGNLAPMFASNIVGSKTIVYRASADPKRAWPLTSSPRSAFANRDDQEEEEDELVATDMDDLYGSATPVVVSGHATPVSQPDIQQS